jgi:microcystin-dependent protein
MATITGLTAARMQEIEAASIIDGDIVAGHLILTKHDGTQIDAGPVAGPAGPPGPTGPQGLSAIPGEVKLWPSDTLPELADWGKWVWADGGAYDIATYPVAASHIAAAWKTFDGASDPGAGKFRVPDLRGLIPAGMDQMPSGARANRMTRTAAVTLAARTGKETHKLVTSELASHGHPPATGHLHTTPGVGLKFAVTAPGVSEGAIGTLNAYTPGLDDPHSLFNCSTTAYATAPVSNAGGDGAHENVQPSVMVPYIVCLGG